MENPNDFVQIHWTAAHLDEAREIVEKLVTARYVACASIFPLVESWYIWNEELQMSSEVKIILKTKAVLFDKVRALIEELHSYEVPEIVMIRMDRVNESYLRWLSTTTI